MVAEVKEGMAWSKLKKEVYEAGYDLEGSGTATKEYVMKMIEKVPTFKQLIGKFKLTFELKIENIDASGRVTEDNGVRTMTLSPNTFNRNLYLAAVIGHELVHVFPYQFKIYQRWEIQYKETTEGSDYNAFLYSIYMGEVGAYNWNLKYSYDAVSPGVYKNQIDFYTGKVNALK